MMIQWFFAIPRKSIMGWLGVLAGMGLIIGCGGGGGTGSRAGNQTQSVSISSPAGTYFKEGENIVFSGSAADTDGGPLIGTALEWRSSMDGLIGTGTTLITSALSAGDHDITLTATDSAGAVSTATLPAISVAKTRFIKMGTQTTGVPDASNAFDGNLDDPAATLVTPDTEFIHFKAHLGGADAFLFKIMAAASTPGLSLAIEGLEAADGTTWATVDTITIDATDQTAAPVTIKVADPQAYKGADGYINLRARWVGGQSPDNISIYEIWRIDPVYAGPQTTGVGDADQAFDGDISTSATITDPWVSGPNEVFLHFKAYIGIGFADTFSFSILLNNMGKFQSLFIDVDNLTTATWDTQDSLSLDTATARTVTVPVTPDYLDSDGYISLRARWINGNSAPPSKQVNVYEIQRIDPFFLDPRTAFGYIQNVENAVDQDRDSYTIMHNYWGENGRFDSLNVAVYVGEIIAYTFSIKTAQSTAGYESALIVEGEREPDVWSLIETIPLDQDVPGTNTIELLNARQFINAAGWLSLRVRWEYYTPISNPLINGYIYEIWPGVN